MLFIVRIISKYGGTERSSKIRSIEHLTERLSELRKIHIFAVSYRWIRYFEVYIFNC